MSHSETNPSALGAEKGANGLSDDLGMRWSLPANWEELPTDVQEGARVASADQLDNGVAKAVAMASPGSLIFHGEADDSLHGDPFLDARIARMNLSVQTLDAQLFPLYVDSFPGTCHGYACWQEYGWSVHGTHAESPMVTRVETGFSLAMPSTEGCVAETEPVNTWLQSPWVTVTESRDIQAIRWIDDMALEGDWDSASAELRLEYRFRDRLGGLGLEGDRRWRNLSR